MLGLGRDLISFYQTKSLLHLKCVVGQRFLSRINFLLLIHPVRVPTLLLSVWV